MELLPLVKKDFKELAAFIHTASPGLDFVDIDVLERQTFSDPDYDSSYLIKAVEKKQLVASGIGVARKIEGSKVGFIKYFGVLPKFRHRGIGQAIFSELERRFQKREAREVCVGNCPPPFFQGGVGVTDTATVSLLLKRGYQRQGEIIDMTALLSKWEPKTKDGDKVLIKEFLVRKASAKDEAILLEMAQTHFPNWAYEIRAGIKHGLIWMAQQEGRAVAFCCADATHPGFFGPMGTVDSLRGRGLARILLNKTLESMKKSGYKSVRIPWVGPIPFYARYAGATLGPIYWHFSKKI